MALPWSQALPFLRGAVAKGISANETLRQLQEAGFGRRRTDFLREYRELAQRLVQGNTLKYIRMDYKPSRGQYGPPEYFISKNYRYEVTFNWIDANTGQPKTAYNWVTSDEELTRRQAEDEAWNAFGKDISKYAMDTPQVLLSQAWIADWVE